MLAVAAVAALIPALGSSGWIEQGRVHACRHAGRPLRGSGPRARLAHCLSDHHVGLASEIVGTSASTWPMRDPACTPVRPPAIRVGAEHVMLRRRESRTLPETFAIQVFLPDRHDGPASGMCLSVVLLVESASFVVTLSTVIVHTSGATLTRRVTVSAMTRAAGVPCRRPLDSLAAQPERPLFKTGVDVTSTSACSIAREPGQRFEGATSP